MAAMKGKTSDRRALSLTLSLYGASLTSCPMNRYFTDSRAYFQGQCAVADKCGSDMLFSPFVLTAEAEAFGSTTAQPCNNPPVLKKHAISDIHDISRIQIPDPDTHPRLLYIREALNMMVSHLGSSFPIAAPVTSPMDLPVLLMGLENWLEIILFNDSLFEDVRQICTEHFVSWANILFAQGASVLVIPSMFSNPSLISEILVCRIMLPALNSAFGRLNGPIIFHHGGQKLTKHLHLYKDLPNIAGFLIGHQDNLLQAREVLGPNMLLMGNLDGPSLRAMTPHQIRRQCVQILDQMSADRNFILASANADIAAATPAENLESIISAIADSSIPISGSYS